MKSIELNIENGIITLEQQEKAKAFLGKHIDKVVNAKLEVIDNNRWWQHKYLHGFLIPDIVDCWGEWNAKFILKKQFLLKDIWSLNDIPNKHKKNCMIVVDEEGIPVAYIPSLSVLTFDEMNKFIKDCEFFLFDTIQGHINPDHQDKAQHARSQFI